MAVADLRTAADRLLAFISQRRRAYQLAFGSSAGNVVLADLAKFCRGAETCYHDDPRKHAVLEGRREVWIRIQDHLNLTEQQVYALYAGRNIIPLNKEQDDDVA